MSRPEISGIAPFFISRNVPAALAFYRDRFVEVKDGDDYLLFFGHRRS